MPSALCGLLCFCVFISIKGVVKAVKMQHKQPFCLLHILFSIAHALSHFSQGKRSICDVAWTSASEVQATHSLWEYDAGSLTRFPVGPERLLGLLFS